MTAAWRWAVAAVATACAVIVLVAAVSAIRKADRSLRTDQLSQGAAEQHPAVRPGDICRGAFARAWDAGAKIPQGWAVVCPSARRNASGTTWFDRRLVTINLARVDALGMDLDYVVRHEIGHTWLGADECAADRYARDHGASLATSPYRSACGL